VLASQPNVKLEGGRSYTFIVSGRAAKPDIIVIEDDVAKSQLDGETERTKRAERKYLSALPPSSPSLIPAPLYPSLCSRLAPRPQGDAMNLRPARPTILLSPRTEWEVIDAEPTTPAQLLYGYVMLLAAIGPIAQLIGYSVSGSRSPSWAPIGSIGSRLPAPS